MEFLRGRLVMCMMSVGIVGLPNAGKSTLFNSLTKASALVANYPFTTVDPNIGVVPVPDERLMRLSEVSRPEKVTPATIEFVDIAGLVRGASRGEGLGNRFLAHIREVDLVAHVVRAFEDPDVTHVEGGPDPIRDIGIVDTELMLADLETLDRRMERVERLLKTGEPSYREEMELLVRMKDSLEKGEPVRSMELSEEERERVQGLFLLTGKPVVYVANLSEDEVPAYERGQATGGLREILGYAAKEGAPVVALSAKLEWELSEFPEEESREYLRELGIPEPGIERFVRAAYKALDLITFFTIKGRETRAWSIKRGTRAREAAGKIHTDMEHGFIRAEVIGFEDLMTAGSMAAARERGLVRSEGRDYEVEDGDVILFRFSV